MATSKVGLTTNAITGILPTANGGTGNTSGAAITATANGADNRVATYSSTTALNGEANLTFDGSTFTATGTSSLDGAVVINETGADLDFRVEGDTDINMIYGDASSNNVGIGLATPMGKLHIRRASSGATGVQAASDELTLEGSGDSGMCILSGNSDSGIIHFGDDGNNQIGYIYYSHGTNSLGFGSNGATRAVFDTNGYYLMMKTVSDAGAQGTELHGNQTIVTRNDTYPSFVARKNSADGSIIQFMRDTSEVGSISVTSSATAFNTSSDYRLKENVDYDFDATTRLKQLKPARFNFKKDETNTLVDGFLAHEVSSMVPEAITGTKDETETKQKVILNADGTLLTDNIEEANWITGKSNEVLYTADDELPEGKNIGDVKTEAAYKSDTTWVASKVVSKYQGIDQSKLVPLLVKSLQEALAEIDTLKTKVTALESA